MKERIISICLLLLAAVTACLIITKLPKKEYAQPAGDFTNAVREGTYTPSPAAAPSVAGEVIRLHILADNDSRQDQAVKLALRDILLPYLHAATIGAGTREEALAQLEEQCAAFTEIANAALTQLGAGYTATVSVENLYFPIRIYGSQTYLSEEAVLFPPGYYDSVQVVLGSGEGHNWWCLVYPSLCFIDSSYDYIPKDSDLYKLKIGTLKKSEVEELFYGKELSGILPETLWEKTGSDEEITIYFGSKLWELLKKLFS